MKVTKISRIYLNCINEDERFTVVKLTRAATLHEYWKTVGLFRKDAFSKPGQPFKFQRTGKTIVDRFAGFADRPFSVDIWVKIEDGSKLLITVRREPRDDGVNANQGYTTGVVE